MTLFLSVLMSVVTLIYCKPRRTSSDECTTSLKQGRAIFQRFNSHPQIRRYKIVDIADVANTTPQHQDPRHCASFSITASVNCSVEHLPPRSVVAVPSARAARTAPSTAAAAAPSPM
eukprot:m.70966 g.70966  ORF g.70966 m.70966 type:complete len:117 (+) comp10044_c0_seq1:1923-2273(+)